MLGHFVGRGNTLNKAIGHSEKPGCQMWKLLWVKPTSFLPVTLTWHFRRPKSLPSKSQTIHLSRVQCSNKRDLRKSAVCFFGPVDLFVVTAVVFNCATEGETAGWKAKAGGGVGNLALLVLKTAIE